MLLLSSADFSKLTFLKKNLSRTLSSVSNSMNLDQDQHSVGPDLGTNYLQKLTADKVSEVAASKERVKLVDHKKTRIAGLNFYSSILFNMT